MINGIHIGLIAVFLGLYGLSNNRNVIKMLMSLSILSSGIVLFFVSVAYVPGGSTPLMNSAGKMVDPLPHTFMLTTIVIGLATTALGLALAFHLFEEYETLDVGRMREGSDE